VTAVNVLSHLYPETPQRVVTEITVQQSAEWCAKYHLKSATIQASALWDTGAEICAISSELVQRLNLLKFGTEWIVGFGGMGEWDKYYIDLTLDDNHHIYNVPAVFNPNMKSQDIIIGMNVITQGDFALIRETGGTRFVFKME
jgi:hypothetical protein